MFSSLKFNIYRDITDKYNTMVIVLSTQGGVMAEVNGVNNALQAGYNLKIGMNSKGITFELKTIFAEMAKNGLIKDKDGKGLTKQDALNMYAKLNEIHKATGKDTNYSRIRAGQEFNYTAEELRQLAEASGYEIVEQPQAKAAEEKFVELPEVEVTADAPKKEGVKPDVAEVTAEPEPVKIPQVNLTLTPPSGRVSQLNPSDGLRNIEFANTAEVIEVEEAEEVAEIPTEEEVVEEEADPTPAPTIATPPKPAPAKAQPAPNRYAIGRIDTPFEQATMDMLYTNTNVHTNFLRQANSLLGTVEYARQSELTAAERQKTQAGIIGRYGNSNHQWCAHTVSTIAERSGVKIGAHYAQVQQFINWGARNGIYNMVSEKPISVNNFESVREAKAQSISQQLPNMNEGDLIIWKSPYVAKTDQGLKRWEASHIGILESVDVERGTITVIEGNANIPKSDDKYERYVVRNSSQGVYGDQVVGEPVELNRTDGLIRKVYTIDDLAKFGYSGFINMQSRLS